MPWTFTAAPAYAPNESNAGDAIPNPGEGTWSGGTGQAPINLGSVYDQAQGIWGAVYKDPNTGTYYHNGQALPWDDATAQANLGATQQAFTNERNSRNFGTTLNKVGDALGPGIALLPLGIAGATGTLSADMASGALSGAGSSGIGVPEGWSGAGMDPTLAATNNLGITGTAAFDPVTASAAGEGTASANAGGAGIAEGWSGAGVDPTLTATSGTGAADTALTQLPAPVEDAAIKSVTPFDKFMQFIDPVTGAYTGAKSLLTDKLGLPGWLATGILGTGIGALGLGVVKALSPKVTVPTSATTQPGTIRPYTFVQQRNPYWQPIQQGQVYRGGLPFQNQAFVPGTPYQAAQGGAIPGGGIASLGAYSDGGRMVRGPGTGLSDDIPARINGQQEARLADGEFVIPADVVSALGGGSTDSGSKKLYAMLDRVRSQAHGTTQQIRKVPDKVLPK